MTIAVKKSGSWVVGQGMKMTGTGSGMKAKIVNILGSAENPVELSLSATPVNTNFLSTSQTLSSYPATFYKVEVPAMTTVSFDVSSIGQPHLIKAWSGATKYSEAVTTVAGLVSGNGGTSGGFTWATRAAVKNETGSSVWYLFEVITVSPPQPAFQVRVQTLASLVTPGVSDVMLSAYDGSTSVHTNGVLGAWNIMGEIGISVGSSEWAPGNENWWNNLNYNIEITANGGPYFTTYLRATIDGGTTWSTATFNGSRPIPTYGQYLINMRNMTMPGGGLLSTATAGSNFTLVIESSADGSSWSQIAEVPLVTYA